MRKETVVIITYAVLIMALFAAGLCGCGQKEAGAGETPKSPDIKYYHNGYGTYFVSGTVIEHPADTSTSTVVDWSRARKVRASASGITEKRGIVYKHGVYADGRRKGEPLDLHLDLTMPEAPKDGAMPVIISVPGGGFLSCRTDDKYMDIHRYLACGGYAVVTVQYHVIGEGRYCDAEEDVHDAIGWVKKHAEEYCLDPDRIVLMGHSAGGYLAALAACRDGSGVRCVVNFYGLSDLINNKADYEKAAIEAQHRPGSSDSQFVNGVLSGKGLTDDPEEAEKADPATYIDGDEPPFLHLHGDADLLVSPSQSLHLHEALTAAGVESIRYSVQGAGHGDPMFGTDACMRVVTDFMKEHNE